MTQPEQFFSLIEAAIALDEPRQRALHWAREQYRDNPNGQQWRFWTRRAKRLRFASSYLRAQAIKLKTTAMILQLFGKEADHV